MLAERPEPRDGLLAGIRTGLGAVRTRTWLWIWVAHAGLINLLVISPVFVLGPFIADRYLGGAPAWAVVGISYTAGALVGGLISARRRTVLGAIAATATVITIATLAVPATWRRTGFNNR